MKTPLCSLLLLLTSLSSPAWAAQQAYINGTILTMDSQNNVHNSLLVENGKIKALGTKQNVLHQLEFGSEVIDLKGKTLLPGFIDAHGHFPGSGLAEWGVNLNSPPAGSVKTAEEAITLLKKRIVTLPKGQWLYADGYDDTLLKTPRLLSLNELDRISKEHPIYVSHISGHQAMVNSKALEEMGYNSKTKDPTGGHFGRNPDGSLNGLLLETANDPVKIRALKFPLTAQLKVIKKANQDYLSQGVTTAQSGATPHILVKVLAWLSKANVIPLRLLVYPMANNGKQWADKKISYASDETHKFKMGAVKLFTDGSIQAYSGLLKTPYYVPHADLGKQYKGHQRIPFDAFQTQVNNLHQAGKQIAVHANGDGAIEMVLKAYAQAQKIFYRSDARPIIIHSQMASLRQLKQMKRLGASPSFFNAHVFYWGDRHRNLFLGPKRAQSINPLKSAADLNIPFSLHLDTPVVPMEPMMMLWSATQRKTRSGYVLGPSERISPLQALRAITIDAAWQSFLEADRGSLEVGKLADMVILSENPLKIKDQREIKVLKTIIGGKVVFSAG